MCDIHLLVYIHRVDHRAVIVLMYSKHQRQSKQSPDAMVLRQPLILKHIMTSQECTNNEVIQMGFPFANRPYTPSCHAS